MGNKQSTHRRHDKIGAEPPSSNLSDNHDAFQQQPPPPPSQQQNNQQRPFAARPDDPPSSRTPFFESLSTPANDSDQIQATSAIATKFIIPNETGAERWSSNYMRDSVQFTPEGAQIWVGTLSSVKPYSGGELISRETGLQYGTYSCDMISTNIKGHVTAFFLIASGINEIDVELTGINSNVCWLNIWKGKEQHPVKVDLGFDASQDWHNYAIEWRRGYVAWHIDGCKVYERSDVEIADPETTEFKLAMNCWTHDKDDQWAGRFEMPTDGRNVVSRFRNLSYTP
ncbi:hypothetical protein FBU30_009607 [Linnemannia zychae]|nr:hypothetical protein FBU30_009607 [Linnemannia zychae]